MHIRTQTQAHIDSIWNLLYFTDISDISQAFTEAILASLFVRLPVLETVVAGT